MKTILKSPRRRKCGLIDDRCAVKVVVKITTLVRVKFPEEEENNFERGDVGLNTNGPAVIVCHL